MTRPITMNSTTRLEPEGAPQGGNCTPEGDKNCQLSVGLRLPQTGHYLTRENTGRALTAENKWLRLDFGRYFGKYLVVHKVR